MSANVRSGSFSAETSSLRQRLAVDVEQCYPPAIIGEEPLRGGKPDAARSAGDQGNSL